MTLSESMREDDLEDKKWAGMRMDRFPAHLSIKCNSGNYFFWSK